MKLRVLTITEGLVRVKKSFKSCTLRFPMDENIFNIFLVDSRTVSWSWKNMPDTEHNLVENLEVILSI